MPVTALPTSREIARSAVRSRLASIALQHFTDRGFDNVTVTEIAQVAGVSRSTFLRYFETKEDAVLCSFDPTGDDATARLMDRPADEDDWTALRRSFDDFIAEYVRESEQTIAALRLVNSVPSINAQRLHRQRTWATNLARALDQRHRTPSTGTGEPTTQAVTRATAALTSMTVAVDRWTASDGRLTLSTLVDDAFTALTGMRLSPT